MSTHWGFPSFFVALTALVLAGLVAGLSHLQLTRTLYWAALRACIQLTALSFGLKWIWGLSHIGVVLILLSGMVAYATRVALSRVHHPEYLSKVELFLSLLTSVALVGGLPILIQGDPSLLSKAHVTLPFLGLLLGNSLTGVGLGLDRFIETVRSERNQIETDLALGASREEALREVRVKAVRAGMTPILNSMLVVGIVSFPGTMAGQVVAGVDPVQAALFQAVVLLSVGANVFFALWITTHRLSKRLISASLALQLSSEEVSS